MQVSEISGIAGESGDDDTWGTGGICEVDCQRGYL